MAALGAGVWWRRFEARRWGWQAGAGQANGEAGWARPVPAARQLLGCLHARGCKALETSRRSAAPSLLSDASQPSVASPHIHNISPLSTGRLHAGSGSLPALPRSLGARQTAPMHATNSLLHPSLPSLTLPACAHLITHPPARPPTYLHLPAAGSIRDHFLTQYQKAMVAVVTAQFGRKSYHDGKTGVLSLAQEHGARVAGWSKPRGHTCKGVRLCWRVCLCTPPCTPGWGGPPCSSRAPPWPAASACARAPHSPDTCPGGCPRRCRHARGAAGGRPGGG